MSALSLCLQSIHLEQMPLGAVLWGSAGSRPAVKSIPGSVRELSSSPLLLPCPSPLQARGQGLILCAGQTETQGLPTDLLGVRKPVLCEIFTVVQWNDGLEAVSCAVIVILSLGWKYLCKREFLCSLRPWLAPALLEFSFSPRSSCIYLLNL